MTQDLRMPADQPAKPRKLVTITYFVTVMLGLNSRQWYYNHLSDPNLPRRVQIGGGKPMLVYDECIAYVEKALKDRAPARQVRRHRGRPAKLHAAR
jgi:predicted DNA-binding transcriptional regulator AlpA